MSLAKTIILSRDADANLATENVLRETTSDIKIISAPTRSIEKQVYDELDWNEFAAIILTSSNALKYFDDVLPSLPTYCVGKKTAMRAEEKGLPVQLVAGDLAELKEKIALLSKMHFLHVRGVVTSADFEDDARLTHHQFSERACYRVIERDWSQIEQDRIKLCSNPLFLVFSQASAHALLANISALPSQFRADILPISRPVAVEFDKFPNLNVLNCPDRPDLASMIRVMDDFSTNSDE